jgi:hypothetical protein
MHAVPPATIDRYRIVGEIGRGAMGTVFRAHDPRLDREVAVKTIAGVVGEGTEGDELTVRFEREARVAARLRHPNVVTVHDAGRDGDRLFLVLELVEGESLSARLGRGDFPSTAEALEIAAQAADALAAAHAAGVVHRDIKPGNLLLAKDGRTLVTDFGIAKALGETSELTRTGMVVGSPAYLSPEQVQGLPLDGRSDLFSLGVVLFEMVLQRKPFAAETFTSLVYQILTVDPLAEGDDLRALPPPLADLLRHALAKDREHRLPDARLFAARAREIVRALPESNAVTAPTLVLAAASPAAAAAATAVPLAATAPTAGTPIPAEVERTAPPPILDGRGPWFGFLLGVLAVTALVAVYVLASGRAAPPPPDAGAPPAEAVADMARPMAQPAAPAARRAEPAAPAPAEPEPTAAVPVPPGTTIVRSPPPESLYTWPAGEQPPVQAPAAAAPPVTMAPIEIASTPAPAPPPVAGPPPASSEPAIAERFETRSAAEFHVSPEEAVVAVDGVIIGKADDWDGMGGGKAWVFPGPGTYLVRLEAEGYRTAWVQVVVRAEAEEEVIDVDTELEENP